jgi:MerR family transcriptional regulator/heat shock protein HspR
MRTDNVDEMNIEDEPCYVISVAAKMLGLHAQTLRSYERMGLVEPSRSQGNFRLYSRSDLMKVKQIKRLMTDLGVNLAGVEVILRMSDKMQEMERQIQRLHEEVRIARERRALPEPSPAALQKPKQEPNDRDEREVIYL